MLTSSAEGGEVRPSLNSLLSLFANVCPKPLTQAKRKSKGLKSLQPSGLQSSQMTQIGPAVPQASQNIQNFHKIL